MLPIRVIALFVLPCSLPLSVLAADPGPSGYPSRPIRVVVPQSPGGATDLVGRMAASMLSEQLNQSVVVENRAGAATIVGSDHVAKSAPDGYTLLMVPSSFAIIQALNKNVPFDSVRDFATITTLSTYPNVIVAHPSVPANSIKALIALAKARPGQLNYSSGGVGTGTHLGAELFNSLAGTRIIHIQFKGGGPALTALLSGEVPLHFAPMSTAIPIVKAGRVRALGVSSGQRSSFMPGVPTVAEAGVPGYEQVTWNGMVAPARTPPAVIRTLSNALTAALKSADTRERFAVSGLTPGGISPEEFSAMLKREIEKWGKLIRDLGIKPEE